jgi:hypothetical protein
VVVVGAVMVLVLMDPRTITWLASEASRTIASAPELLATVIRWLRSILPGGS